MPGLATKLAIRYMSLMIVWVPEAACTRGAQDFWSGAGVGLFRFVCADDTRVGGGGKPWRCRGEHSLMEYSVLLRPPVVPTALLVDPVDDFTFRAAQQLP